MITALDHLVLVTHDIDQAVAAYETLFGRRAAGRREVEGATAAFFTLANTGLEIIAPTGDGAVGDRVRAALDEGGPRLTTLAFRVVDIEAAHRTLERRNLKPEPIVDSATGKRTRSAAPAGWGIKLFYLQRDAEPPPSPPFADGPLDALDHVVVATKHPERAAALYGARLGLDMALDRSNEQWGTRLQFFRLGDLVIEVSFNLKDAPGSEPDRLWGATWRTADLDATHRRLDAAGVDISGVRPGRKPGTRVFSVRNGTGGVPTLILEASPATPAAR